MSAVKAPKLLPQLGFVKSIFT